jgi:hypothetical protein
MIHVVLHHQTKKVLERATLFQEALYHSEKQGLANEYKKTMLVFNLRYR